MSEYKPAPPRADERPQRQGGFESDGELFQLSNLGAEGQALWDHLTTSMPKGLMQSVDSVALFAMCRWFGIWRHWECQADDTDPAIAYKASCMAGAAWKHFEGLAKQFGLTPRSRQGIKYDKVANGSTAFDKFLNRQLSVRQN